MKKTVVALLILAFAMTLLLSSCGKSAPKDTTGRYALSESGEAVINDINTDNYIKTDDNARVFYEIFVGSFSDSDGDGVGDIRGIIERFDYLNDGDDLSGESLGVEGIWLTPIFKSNSYHKYNVNDYYAIDPSFGTEDDLRELIALCRERNVKLILDLPINHTGRLNPMFSEFTVAHRQNDTENKYYDYYCYYVSGETAPAGRAFSQLSGTNIFFECNFSGDMPELNFDNENVREEVVNIAKYYLDMGVDGFRFDAAKYIYFGDNEKSAEFWKWYIGELEKINPDIYTVGEVWDGDGITDKYFEALNCFNFTLSQENGSIAQTAKGGNVNAYTSYVEKYISNIESARDGSMIVQFIANHDTDRAAGHLTVSSGNMQMAANIYLLSPGSPFIYYGEEIGLRGSRGGAQTDANRRLAMLWGDDDTVKDPSGSTYPLSSQTNGTVADQKGNGDSLLNYYKKLIMIRKANPEICRGEYRALSFSGTKLGGFTSSYGGKTVCVLHNTTGNDITVDLATVTDIDFTLISAVIGAGDAKLDGSSLTLSSKTSVVLRTK